MNCWLLIVILFLGIVGLSKNALSAGCALKNVNKVFNSGNVWLLSLNLLQYIFSDKRKQFHLLAPHLNNIFADTYDPEEENDNEQSTIYPNSDLQRKALIELVKDILHLWSIFHWFLKGFELQGWFGINCWLLVFILIGLSKNALLAGCIQCKQILQTSKTLKHCFDYEHTLI